MRRLISCILLLILVTNPSHVFQSVSVLQFLCDKALQIQKPHHGQRREGSLQVHSFLNSFRYGHRNRSVNNIDPNVICVSQVRDSVVKCGGQATSVLLICDLRAFPLKSNIEARHNLKAEQGECFDLMRSQLLEALEFMSRGVCYLLERNGLPFVCQLLKGQTGGDSMNSCCSSSLFGKVDVFIEHAAENY